MFEKYLYWIISSEDPEMGNVQRLQWLHPQRDDGIVQTTTRNWLMKIRVAK